MIKSPRRGNKMTPKLSQWMWLISSMVFFPLFAATPISYKTLANENLTNPLADNTYTLYLVRHAEKLDNSNNPPLTKCGLKRANQLATILSPAKIRKIYSTDYLRTMATASPLADQQQLPIKKYSPDDLQLFAETLKSNKQNTLVVGHSNTTARLAGLITEQSLEDINDKEYQLLYQIHISDNDLELTMLKQPLNCN